MQTIRWNCWLSKHCAQKTDYNFTISKNNQIMDVFVVPVGYIDFFKNVFFDLHLKVSDSILCVWAKTNKKVCELHNVWSQWSQY